MVSSEEFVKLIDNCAKETPLAQKIRDDELKIKNSVNIFLLLAKGWHKCTRFSIVIYIRLGYYIYKAAFK